MFPNFRPKGQKRYDTISNPNRLNTKGGEGRVRKGVKWGRIIA